MRNIVILVDRLEETLLSASPAGQYKILGRIVSRSACSNSNRQPLRKSLFHVFGLDEEQGAAPFNMLADGLLPGNDYYMHADPVSLYVDMARVFITHWGAAELASSDREALAVTLVDHFKAEQMRLHTPTAKRWYLRAKASNGPGFPPPDEALGMDIGELLPDRPEAGFWKIRLNECQMILHDHPVNQRLCTQHQPVVNSLWFWGGGKLPEPPAGDIPGVVLANDSLSRGLARWASVPVVHDFRQMLMQPTPNDGLVVFSAAAGEQAHMLKQLEQFMAWPLDALKNRQIDRLTLQGNQLRFDLERKDWRAIWRQRNFTRLASRLK